MNQVFCQYCRRDLSELDMWSGFLHYVPDTEHVCTPPWGFFKDQKTCDAVILPLVKYYKDRLADALEAALKLWSPENGQN